MTRAEHLLQLARVRASVNHEQHRCVYPIRRIPAYPTPMLMLVKPPPPEDSVA